MEPDHCTSGITVQYWTVTTRYRLLLRVIRPQICWYQLSKRSVFRRTARFFFFGYRTETHCAVDSLKKQLWGQDMGQWEARCVRVGANGSARCGWRHARYNAEREPRSDQCPLHGPSTAQRGSSILQVSAPHLLWCPLTLLLIKTLLLLPFG
jgi:hypothetical protein